MKQIVETAIGRGLPVRVHLVTGDKVDGKITFQTATHIHLLPASRDEDNPRSRWLPKEPIKKDFIVRIEFL